MSAEDHLTKLPIWAVPQGLFDGMTVQPVVDNPNEWSLHHSAEQVAEQGIEIGTQIALDCYYTDPVPLGQVIRITPHESIFGSGLLVTIDSPKPWRNFSDGPMFFQWVVAQ